MPTFDLVKPHLINFSFALPLFVSQLFLFSHLHLLFGFLQWISNICLSEGGMCFFFSRKRKLVTDMYAMIQLCQIRQVTSFSYFLFLFPRCSIYGTLLREEPILSIMKKWKICSYISTYICDCISHGWQNIWRW